MIHKAKKSLGQNFLKAPFAIKAMCEAGNITNKDTIIEIGPGKGVLTTELLLRAKKVIAIEKDRDLVDLLKEKFEKEIESGKLKLISNDVLDIEIKEKSYKLIANIPYNITGAIFKKFLTNKNQPENMVVLVQKEVAQRVCDKKESILSLSVKAYGIPKYIIKVPKRYFTPSPKVDSAILSIQNINRNNFKNKKEEEKFFEVIKTGFAHKRKVLKKNLEDISDKEKINNIFEILNISEKTRAEELSLQSWLNITQKI